VVPPAFYHDIWCILERQVGFNRFFIDIFGQDMILRHPADTRGNFFSSACADRYDNIHPVSGYFFRFADMED
jgi:hypothetical protein